MTKLFTVPQAAEKLGFHEMTIRRYIRTGLIPVIRISGTRIRIEETELQRFVDALKAKAATVNPQ